MNEPKDFIMVSFIFLLVIAFTAWNDRHYLCRVRISSKFNKFFFNNVKNQTVPLISLVTAIEFYLSIVVIALLKILNEGVDSGNLLYRYLFVPWIILVNPIVMIIEIIAHHKRRK